ncbi:ABC transporter permease subunit [Alkalihalobacillus sp. CinArs1]|uniref:ABC transporter permease subunit n=1 Tax=Alkalihalobacillus sp. CinArs1 TaxID=2995314 RepID=UPI0022DD41F3|nr:ABC transporter permease subunit [Alkalihalobacillus sp. CinArs1]
MIRGVYRFGVKFIASFVGVLLLGALPGLFNGMKLDLGGYGDRLVATIQKLMAYNELTFRVGDNQYPLFPELFTYLNYSLILLFSALILAFISALGATYLTMMLPIKFKQMIKRGSFLFESLPDVFILACVQIGVIWFYKKTSILLVDIAAFERIYAMPILVLSILPALLFYRIMLHVFEEEAEKPYVELAKTKGVAGTALMFVHMFRNALLPIYFHSRSIIWFALSNLFIMEFVFNLNGIICYMYTNPTPELFTVGALLLFVPIFIILGLYQLLAERVSKAEAL